jgi:hypothetical protein
MFQKLNLEIDKRPKLAWFLKTNIGRITLSAIICVIGGIADTYLLPLFMTTDEIENFSFFRWMTAIGGVYLSINAILMFYFAFKNLIKGNK